MTSKRPTLKDLAEAVGVSTATISNAFNRPDQLSRELRETIMQCASKLGYSGPDIRGKTLRTGRSNIIAVLLAENLFYNVNDSVASELISGIAERLDAHGQSLMLLSNRNKNSPIESASMADGFIVYGLQSSKTQEWLLNGTRPIVTVDFSLRDIPSVHVDNYSASLELARHALKTPCKRVGIIALRVTEAIQGRVDERDFLPTEQTITRSRIEGFQQALREQGIDPHSVPIWNIDHNTYQGSRPTLEAIFDQPDKCPDLLLCVSDRIALTAMDLACERGMRIPEDIRITGFDGIEEGQRRLPKLTTVEQNSYQKGRVAAEILLGERAFESAMLETNLLIGDSAP